MSSYMPVLKVGDLQDGESTCIEAGGLKLAIFFTEGEYYCIDELCTHANVSLCGGEVSDKEVFCPLHMASFSLLTGEATGPPAYDPVNTYPVRISGDMIEVQI